MKSIMWLLALAVLLWGGCEKASVDAEQQTGFATVTNKDGSISLVTADGQRYMMMPDEPHAK